MIASKYYNGAPNRCAYCTREFAVLQGARQCYRGEDNRYYCSAEHATKAYKEKLEHEERTARIVH